MKKHSECPLCGSKKITPLGKYYTKKGLVKCKKCHFVFMEKIPSQEELFEHYKNYSYYEEQQVSPITVQRYHELLDEFEKYRKNNRLLDVGCGRGFFLREARKRGWEVYGTEFSRKAVELLKKENIPVIDSTLTKETFPENHFDVITSFEVLEHVAFPRKLVSPIRHYLRQDGIFYCTTPNFNSLLRYYLKTEYSIIEYPEHLGYFTRKTLNYLMKKHGFKNIKFLSTGISLNRLRPASQIKTSKKNSDTRNPDEELRHKISSKKYLQIAKNVVNKILTWTNTGMTLKGYYIKE